MLFTVFLAVCCIFHVYHQFGGSTRKQMVLHWLTLAKDEIKRINWDKVWIRNHKYNCSTFNMLFGCLFESYEMATV